MALTDSFDLRSFLLSSSFDDDYDRDQCETEGVLNDRSYAASDSDEWFFEELLSRNVQMSLQWRTPGIIPSPKKHQKLPYWSPSFDGGKCLFGW